MQINRNLIELIGQKQPKEAIRIIYPRVTIRVTFRNFYLQYFTPTVRHHYDNISQGSHLFSHYSDAGGGRKGRGGKGG